MPKPNEQEITIERGALDELHPELPSIEDETQDRHASEPSKKAISLRVPLADLNRAKALAEELNTGYQTLLQQLIHEGLAVQEEDLKFRRMVNSIKASLPDLKAAQELANSPAVKAAQDLLSSPAIKASEALMASPALKAAQEFAHSPAIQKWRETGSKQALKAAQEIVNSPVVKLIKELGANPAFLAAQEFANTTSARIARDWANSPGGRLARELTGSAHGEPEQPNAVAQAIKEIQQALKKLEDVEPQVS